MVGDFLHGEGTNIHICIIISGTFGATLAYMVKDCDPTTGLPDSDDGYDDTYMVRLI